MGVFSVLEDGDIFEVLVVVLDIFLDFIELFSRFLEMFFFLIWFFVVFNVCYLR